MHCSLYSKFVNKTFHTLFFSGNSFTERKYPGYMLFYGIILMHILLHGINNDIILSKKNPTRDNLLVYGVNIYKSY